MTTTTTKEREVIAMNKHSKIKDVKKRRVNT
jgi:hypothetical protein